MENVPGILFFAGLTALLVVLIVRSVFKRVTVMEYERGLRYKKGRFVGVVTHGRHWVRPPNSVIFRLDTRPQYLSVVGQEVLTADGVSLRVSLIAKFEIADPALAINSVQDYTGGLYLELQLAAREVIGTAQVDDLLGDRAAFAARLAEIATPKVADLGLNLLSVDLKDLMFPGDLKRLFASVVQARKEGEAALERARGETAALRNLANAARMVADNPALVQLRLLQQVSDSQGNTFVIGLPGGATPIPVRGEPTDAGQLPPSDAAEPSED